jgi:hypothetical protein
MTEEKKNSINYRFSGYLPPLISLGGNTDAGYWFKFYTHPYYINQPECWKQPTYRVGDKSIYSGLSNADPSNTVASGQPLQPLRPICKK